MLGLAGYVVGSLVALPLDDGCSDGLFGGLVFVRGEGRQKSVSKRRLYDHFVSNTFDLGFLFNSTITFTTIAAAPTFSFRCCLLLFSIC